MLTFDCASGFFFLNKLLLHVVSYLSAMKETVMKFYCLLQLFFRIYPLIRYCIALYCLHMLFADL